MPGREFITTILTVVSVISLIAGVVYVINSLLYPEYEDFQVASKEIRLTQNRINHEIDEYSDIDQLNKDVLHLYDLYLELLTIDCTKVSQVSFSEGQFLNYQEDCEFLKKKYIEFYDRDDMQRLLEEEGLLESEAYEDTEYTKESIIQ